MNTAVAVVLDSHFGDCLAELAQRLHVWVCNSPDNQSAVQAIWAIAGLYEAGRGATLFGACGNPEAVFLAELDTIDLHHPCWQVMEVYGLGPTFQVQQALQKYGVMVFSSIAGGFIATRPVQSET